MNRLIGILAERVDLSSMMRAERWIGVEEKVRREVVMMIYTMRVGWVI